MKHRFLKTIALAFPLSILMVFGLKFATLAHMRSQLNFSLGADKKVLVLGNSHGRDAICDSLLPGWANRCADGEVYFGVYQLAKRMLDQNKIDTLVIHMVDFESYPDENINTNFMLYESSRMALADEELLSRLWQMNWGDLLSFYCINDVQAMLKPVEVGGYEHWDHHNLSLELKNLEYRLANKGKTSTPKNSIAHYTLQTHYLNRIIQLCKQEGVQLVMVNYPKYKRSKYFDRSKAWDYYTTLEGGLLIADYENFVFPDSTYFANCTHLNYHGAELFTSSLRKEGLKLQSPKAWRSTRKD
ncbi:MAG: hypothetical protein MJZ63_04120 [Muribaculaceae bacterium]|nr:hypothetical protein [Muribaculaceae bacterium]